jgi:hypothetical protein
MENQKTQNQGNSSPSESPNAKKSRLSNKAFQNHKNTKYDLRADAVLDPTGMFVVPPTKINESPKRKTNAVARTNSSTSLLSNSSRSSNPNPKIKPVKQTQNKPLSRASSTTSLMSNCSQNSLDSEISEIPPTQKIQPAKPIFVASAYQVVFNELNNLSLSSKPLLKIKSSRQTHVFCANVADKDAVMKRLKEKQYQHYTYSEPGKKPKMFVLKGFHAASCDEVLQSLNEAKIPASKVTQLFMKEDYQVYLVHFEESTLTFDSLTRTRAIGSVIVTWERFDHSRKRLSQCKNCQRYGHAASNCSMIRRCVKCTETHEPKQCARKSRTDEGTPKCVNCNGQHAANHRQCPAYQSYSSMIQQHRRPTTRIPQQRPASTAHQAFLGGAASFDKNFPRLLQSQSKPVSMNRIVNPAESNNSLNSFSDAQKRFQAIPGIAATIQTFCALVASLESAQSEQERISILFKHCVPHNVY